MAELHAYKYTYISKAISTENPEICSNKNRFCIKQSSIICSVTKIVLTKFVWKTYWLNCWWLRIFMTRVPKTGLKGPVKLWCNLSRLKFGTHPMRWSIGTPKGNWPNSSASCVNLAFSMRMSCSPEMYPCNLPLRSLARTACLVYKKRLTSACQIKICNLRAWWDPIKSRFEGHSKAQT